MSTAFVVLALSLLLGLQPVTTDLYLPALPSITQDLGASVAQAQLTLSGLLLAFGLSQLIFLYLVVKTVTSGEPAPAKPWEGAEGLEWTLPSPAPYHSFSEPPEIR